MPYHILENVVLQHINKKTPRKTEELLEINDIGKVPWKNEKTVIQFYIWSHSWDKQNILKAFEELCQDEELDIDDCTSQKMQRFLAQDFRFQIVGKQRTISRICDMGFLQSDPNWLYHKNCPKIQSGFRYFAISLNVSFIKKCPTSCEFLAEENINLCQLRTSVCFSQRLCMVPLSTLPLPY